MKDYSLITVFAALVTGFFSHAQNPTDTTLLIKEAVVKASKNPARDGVSSITVPAKMIKGTPVILGESDVLKTIQLLPGIQAGTEGLSGMYVRGGGSDENLILLDGIPVHCQGHILGLFSPFQSEAISDAVIHKGAFPAKFGGRASSVLEINTEGDVPVRTSGCLGAGLLSDKFHIEGPLAGGRIDYSVSGRGMHTFLMDGVIKTFKIPANYYFRDLHARATGRIDSKNSLTLSFFSSKDKLYYKEEDQRTDILWGTSLGAARWKRRWGETLSSELSLALTGYSLDNQWKRDDTKEGYKTGLQDIVIKTDWLLMRFPGHNLRFGLGIISHTFAPESDFEPSSKKRIKIKGLEEAAYIEDSFSVRGWVSVKAGLRMGAYSSDEVTRLNPEPRISIALGREEGLRTTMSYSRTTQHLHQLSSTIAVLPVDLTVPVTKAIGPLVSDHMSIGLKYDRHDSWEMSIEGYLKEMRGTLEYKDGVVLIDDFTTWEEQVSAGNGRSYGLEAFIRKESGKTSGWMAYTLARSERRFPDGSISDGKWFPARYDIRHSIAVVLNQEMGRGWDSSVVWTYSSGGAITVPEKDGSIPHGSTPLTNRGSTPLTNLRGNYRLPPSHRMDLGLSHHKSLRHGERVWNIGVYNAYNKKNPNLVIPLAGDEDEGSGPFKTISFLPIIPSVSYTRVF